MAQCSDCGQVFTERRNLLRHMKNAHVDFTCEVCNRLFFGETAFNKHKKQVHEKIIKIFSCLNCYKTFGRSDNLSKHTKTCKKGGSGIGEKRPAAGEINEIPSKKPSTLCGFSVIKRRDAFRGAVETWRLEFNDADDVIGPRISL